MITDEALRLAIRALIDDPRGWRAPRHDDGRGPDRIAAAQAKRARRASRRLELDDPCGPPDDAATVSP